jgi:hypothetical protein
MMYRLDVRLTLRSGPKTLGPPPRRPGNYELICPRGLAAVCFTLRHRHGYVGAVLALVLVALAGPVELRRACASRDCSAPRATVWRGAATFSSVFA